VDALTSVFCNRQDHAVATTAGGEEAIFAIGKEDKTDLEFRNTGWLGIEDYVCQIGTNYENRKFPAELHIRGAYESYGVVKLKILFETKRPHKKTMLRLVRGGAETTIVKVDGQRTYEVTSTMLGSGEGFHVGAYTLDIGNLEKGKHYLDFTVAEDGKGNGAYQWDALSLVGT